MGAFEWFIRGRTIPKAESLRLLCETCFSLSRCPCQRKIQRLFIGKTYFAPETVLERDVAPADDKYTDLICWETTVGPHGQIHSENDISWMKGGRLDIRGYVSEMDRHNVSFVTSMATNTVQTTIAHRRIAKDARRFYKPGTPAYSVADYVYKNPVVNLPKWGQFTMVLARYRDLPFDLYVKDSLDVSQICLGCRGFGIPELSPIQAARYTLWF